MAVAVSVRLPGRGIGDMKDILVPELNVPFTFKQRPVAVPPDLRPGWRLGLVLLILRKCCKNGRSSFARLHVLNWASRTTETQRALLSVLDAVSRPDAIVVRIEPALNRAVDLASGKGLLRRIGGDRVELTPAGVLAAEQVDQNENVFHEERQYLSSIGRRATENVVNQLFSSYKGGLA